MRINKYKKALSRILPFLIIILYVVIVFQKYIFKGQLPISVNLLMAFYFPFFLGGFKEYSPWVRYKGFLNSDVVRQGLPWKILAFEQIKNLKLPVWNPYTFCGNPLMANIQSAVFYPLNFIFLIFSMPVAWSLLEIIGLFLMLLFMYLFLRELKISKTSALWGAIVFASTQFLIVWLQLNIVIHTLLWLPLALFAFERFKKNSKKRFLFLFALCFFMSILGGHPLSFIYVSLISLSYILFTSNKRNFLTFLFLVFVVVLLASFQLLPSIKIYQHAVTGGEFGKEVFKILTIPWKNLPTFLAPDYFGNNATWNKRGHGGTGDMTPFMGVITLALAPLAFFKKNKKKVWYFTAISLFGFLLAFDSPLNWIIREARIPMLSSTAPARALIATYFGFAVLSSYGLDLILKKKIPLKKVLISIGILTLTFGLLFLLTVNKAFFIENPDVKSKFYISFRNMILPGGTLFASFLFILAYYKWKKKFLVYLLILFNSLFFLYNFDKILTFGSKKFFYPQHKLITFLQKQNNWRFHGSDAGKIDTNFQIPYKIYTPVGYNVLRIKYYAQLADAAFNTELEYSDAFSRADAFFPSQNDPNRDKFFNLTGVKYITNKLENPKPDNTWEQDVAKFPEDKYKLVWQEEHFQVYERRNVYPRSFIATQSALINNPQKAIEKFYDPDFDVRNTLILSDIAEKPHLNAKEGKAEIIDYQPNKVTIKIQTDGKALLFLSDAYYPNWQARVDDKKVEVIRTHHAFRSVVVPKGEHTVEFFYYPKEFYYGVGVSFSVLLSLGIYFVISWKKGQW